MRGISKRLKETRKEQMLSQSELAVKAGVSQTVIYKLENGLILESRKMPGLALSLGVTTDWLISEKGDKYISTLTSNIHEENYNKVPMISASEVVNYCLQGIHSSNCYILCPAIHSEKTFAMKVYGDSMTSPSAGTISLYPIIEMTMYDEIYAVVIGVFIDI